MSRLVATVFGIGYLRPAPGTWGSLAAILLAWAVDRYLGFVALAVLTLAVTALGFWACAQELRDRPGADPGEIVVDEVAGQWLAFLFPAAGFFFRGWEGWLPWPAPVAAFLFFRLFDIWKPWLVGRADRRGDPAGVMLDDLWAGLFAGIASIAAAALYHIVLFR
ncbi:phosphatidylglycerophosphatase A family protein [Neotabrizicola shimadae]|uniref:Phosphatidylglycerophosphatase A n=1 Tax=Neotabrizicola shimadae TaxID=2807096 RepID=A0A8G1EEG3_9RHOB|nr:phosphatidylglycerophosphatase A [Neotabrizicola shimadae]QYZ71263.1 phosphatidylglycerophosphatase A [Neotabrizicola shimadae]